jgi:hypothetical protein
MCTVSACGGQSHVSQGKSKSVKLLLPASSQMPQEMAPSRERLTKPLRHHCAGSVSQVTHAGKWANPVQDVVLEVGAGSVGA